MVVDISLVLLLSIFSLDLTFNIAFFFSSNFFSLSTLSTFSAGLLVAESRLGFSESNFLSLVVFSLISLLLIFSILLLPISIFVFVLSFKVTFLFSSNFFSLWTLSTFSNDLLVTESEWAFPSDDLLFSLIFSLIISLLLDSKL